MGGSLDFKCATRGGRGYFFLASASADETIQICKISAVNKGSTGEDDDEIMDRDFDNTYTKGTILEEMK